MQISILGIDIGENSCSVVGVDDREVLKVIKGHVVSINSQLDAIATPLANRRTARRKSIQPSTR